MFSNRIEESSDPHNDSGIDEFTSTSVLSSGDNFIVTAQDDFCDVDSCSSHIENHTGTQTSSTPCSPVSMESDTSNDTEINSDDIEITIAILKALNLVDQMNGSISDFEDVLQFAKKLYCRNDSNLVNNLPE